MNFHRYIEVLRTPGVARLAVFTFLADRGSRSSACGSGFLLALAGPRTLSAEVEA